MALKLSPEGVEKCRSIVEKLGDKEAALIPVLYVAQDEFGWLSSEAMDCVAELLELPPPRVYGVATFYTMFNKKPVGKYHLQVCTNLSCSLLGAEHVVEYISRKLGIGVGETTTDNKFTLSTVECLGSCGTAPMMQINDEYYENLTEEKIDRILSELSSEG
jgi:NADH-quinone oxidoreductase E subunit